MGQEDGTGTVCDGGEGDGRVGVGAGGAPPSGRQIFPLHLELQICCGFSTPLGMLVSGCLLQALVAPPSLMLCLCNSS